jgi:hypothetical protein
MFERIFRNGLACASLVTLMMLAGMAEARGPIVIAQGYPADGCMTRREAKAFVMSGQAVRLRMVRGVAEQAANGEMINAELCWRGGQVIYVITILSASGKVIYVTLDAATGQLIGTR